jgi:signal peptidase I
MSDQVKPTPDAPPPSPTGVTAQPDGAAAAAPAEPPVTFWEGMLHWAVGRAINAVLFLVLAVVMGVFFWAIGFQLLHAFLGASWKNVWQNQVGFGLLGSFLVGMFFLRQPVMQTFSKWYPNLLPPPPPQPSVGPWESFREVVEMIVFVVVLVLMLKSFVAEAFVIPTGSMAETLWGYQKEVTCPQCGHEFPVNAASQVEEARFVNQCTCPNCRLQIGLYRPGIDRKEDVEGAPVADPGWGSGDRVLVVKYPFDVPGMGPNRLEVVVFRFPGDDGQSGPFPISGPFKQHTAMNYIKRLIGLPRETLAVHRGNIYILSAKNLSPDGTPPYPDDEKLLAARPELRRLMWQTGRAGLYDWIHQTEGKVSEEKESVARKLFVEGKFDILRKPPSIITEVMRLVYNNDQPAKDLLGKEDHVRWLAEDPAWSEDEATRSFRHLGSVDKMAWLRYRHVLRDSPGEPQLITDFLGYNTDRGGGGNNWATDLVVECTVKSEKADGQFALELSQGPRRFQAHFDVGTGECTLYEVGPKGAKELKKATTSFKGAGTFNLRFANVDDRLTVWVNGSLPFGDGFEFTGLKDLAPTEENDLERPVSIGAQGGGFTVRHLKIFRDTYYTCPDSSHQASTTDIADFKPKKKDKETWRDYKDAPLATYYVQPGHYFCMGDNSPQSSDSRAWGLVPRRLMLGRAVMVYFPFTRFGRIR